MTTLPDKNKDILKKLITENLQEEISGSFTNDVLKQLNLTAAKSASSHKAILPHKGWLVIALFMCLVFILAGIGFSTESQLTTPVFILNMEQLSQRIADAILHSSILVYLTCLTSAVLILLSLESFYLNKRMQSN